jgi:hypothetical protein
VCSLPLCEASYLTQLTGKWQVESLELRTNVIAAYVCGGHAEKVRIQAYLEAQTRAVEVLMPTHR